MIIQYYKRLSLQNGYEVKPPEAVVDRLAHYLLSLNTTQNNKGAIELLKLNVNNYPKSWHVYSSLGDRYVTEKNTKQAIDNYKKALELKPDNKSVQEKIQALHQK
jgi:tetratricopeptide (TPR) repeat protein